MEALLSHVKKMQQSIQAYYMNVPINAQSNRFPLTKNNSGAFIKKIRTHV